MGDRATKVREIVKAHGLLLTIPYPWSSALHTKCLLDRVTQSGYALYRCDLYAGGETTKEYWVQAPGENLKPWAYPDGRFHTHPARPPAASGAKRWTQVAVAGDFDE